METDEQNLNGMTMVCVCALCSDSGRAEHAIVVLYLRLLDTKKNGEEEKSFRTKHIHLMFFCLVCVPFVFLNETFYIFVVGLLLL